MELVQVAQWLFDNGVRLFNSIVNDWGIIGLGLVSTFLLVRVANFMHKFFK